MSASSLSSSSMSVSLSVFSDCCAEITAGKSFCCNFSYRWRTSAGTLSNSSFVSTGPLNRRSPFGSFAVSTFLPSTKDPKGLLQIFCGQHFFAVHFLDPQLAFVVRINNLRFADVDLGCAQATVRGILVDGDVTGRATGFISRPTCFIAHALGLVAHLLSHVALLLG